MRVDCFKRSFIMHGKVRLRLHTSQVAHQALDYPGFCSMKRPGSALDGMLVHRRVTPGVNLTVPIYTAGWREALSE